MPGLRDILDAATREPTFESASSTMAVRKAQGEARRALNALAPELAALVLDMGEALAGIRQNGRPDFGDCGAATCTHSGCLYTRQYDALLARLDRLGKEPSDG